ncbi:MAG TPA: HlyD family efflux transporter periplasmic adaptor subunit [Candidatus Binataceae bacterium]|jgi:HlyD family secretion protein
MNRRTIIIGLAALAALGGVVGVELLNRDAVDGKLVVSGNIEAHQSLVSFKVAGRIVELSVEEGQWEEEGGLLARLEDDDYKQQVAVDEAELKVQEAQLALAMAGSRRQEIDQAKQRVADAEADLKQKQLDYDRAESLYEAGAGSKETRDRADTALKQAQATLARLQQMLNETVEGTRKEDIAIARANLERAKEQLEMGRVALSHTILRAPKAGVITVRQAELGEVVVPGTPVVTLADLNNVWLRGYISETDLGRIRWGTPAIITTDTYPGKQYHGRVSFISSEAEFTPKSVETHKERVTLVYRIKIEVENPNHELKPGMPADAVIGTQAVPATVANSGE